MDGPILSDDSDSSTADSTVSLDDLASDEPRDALPLQTAALPANTVSGSGSRAVAASHVAGPSQPRTNRKIEDVLTPLPVKAITQAALDHLQKVGSRWPLITDDRD